MICITGAKLEWQEVKHWFTIFRFWLKISKLAYPVFNKADVKGDLTGYGSTYLVLAESLRAYGCVYYKVIMSLCATPDFVVSCPVSFYGFILWYKGCIQSENYHIVNIGTFISSSRNFDLNWYSEGSVSIKSPCIYKSRCMRSALYLWIM